MKTSLFWMACVGLTFTMILGGCESTEPTPVSHKPSTSQTSNYTPSYTSQAGGRNTTISTSPMVQSSPVSVSPKNKVVAAILLPLSGQNAALGQAMLNAAQQAVFDSAGDNFELQPHDTAPGAAQAAHEAIAKGAQIIIGPLFASDVPFVENMAVGQNIPILPLSTDTSLSGPGVYVMGLAPGAQVHHVVAYAVARGVRRFAALTPTTPYGVLVAQEYRNAVTQSGAQLVDAETFTSASDIPARVKSMATQKESFDALFLPEGGAVLKSVADQLTAAGFDSAHTHILGTGLWDEPGIGRLSPLLQGAWFAAPDPAARRSFVEAYKSAYGQEPPRLATLVYDATALAAVIAKHGGRYDEASLTNPNGFAGLDGIFRLSPTGVVERAMAVNEVTADGVRVVDPSPSSFAR